MLHITRDSILPLFRRERKEAVSPVEDTSDEGSSSASEPPVRWPAVYDSAELAKTIRKLIEPSAEAQISIYREDESLPSVCQGDIVALKTAIPVIGPSGTPEKIEAPVVFWLVVGNTCDFERDTVSHLSICPVMDYQLVPGVNLDSVRRFKTSRLFHVRPWSDGMSNSLCADLNFMVSADKSALANIAKRETRLSWHGWILLHCCLVRFLARDDGRHD